MLFSCVALLVIFVLGLLLQILVSVVRLKLSFTIIVLISWSNDGAVHNSELPVGVWSFLERPLVAVGDYFPFKWFTKKILGPFQKDADILHTMLKGDYGPA